ncbi:uncharacterized protein LOC111691845 [Anoplophora glabripennis]|uniref:uncharacterized protein LOC111691845 n=1 Tax=Anoplophora glabripennis TaxID=217634 RepID=UPI000C76E1D8|nr:uncharacterized protein LOC111691845 [Anoplophora glabripennis]
MALSGEDQRRVISEFIECYKSEPCLWRIKCKEYHDRGKREAAYKKLVEKLKEIDPAANKDAVIKKVNNLRSNVRKEKKKYGDSIKSGASADTVYHPKLWYYDLFDFLSDQETPRESTSNLDPVEENSSEIWSTQENENSHIADDLNSTSCERPSTTDNAGSSTENENVPCSSGEGNTFIARSRPGKQKRSQDSLTNEVLTTVRDHFKRPYLQEDRFDIIAKSFAIKLRELDKRQSLIAEKLINDVIFEAELGHLTLQHKCVNIQEISDATNRNVQQYQPAMFSRNSVSYPSSHSSSPGHTITPTASPSPNFVQYIQPETSQLQLNPNYNCQRSQSQQFSHTSSAQHCSGYQEHQQSSENVVVMESSTENSAASYLTNFKSFD